MYEVILEFERKSIVNHPGPIPVQRKHVERSAICPATLRDPPKI